LSKEESIPENHAEVEQAPGEHEAAEEQQAPEEVQAEPTSIAQLRPRRVIKPPQLLGWEDEACYAVLASGDNPSSFQEAVESVERQEWMDAMSVEMESLHKNSAWELVLKPKDRKVIGSKWVFLEERKHQ